ncbi:MAG: metal-dependent phosphohydrolase [Ignavibacteriae bacterium]|nr:MAG: metal-dependent phosphohydrolase [Ignavibacteriota bacterium]
MDTKEIEKIVKEACKAETNVFGYNIWTHHIIQVVKIGKKLAEQFNADPEIVEISALLHDYAGIKDYTLHKEHHIHGAIEAEKILKKLNYPSNKIDTVKHCIENHRGSVKSNKKNAEAECLANADAIAHIENVPSLFYLAFAKFGMELDEGVEWLREKLERSWNKLNPDMKKILQDKYEAANKFLIP